MIGEPRYESDHRTCVINVKLEPGRTYGFWINSEEHQYFTDKGGRPAVPYLLGFEPKNRRTRKELVHENCQRPRDHHHRCSQPVYVRHGPRAGY